MKKNILGLIVMIFMILLACYMSYRVVKYPMQRVIPKTSQDSCKESGGVYIPGNLIIPANCK